MVFTDDVQRLKSLLKQQLDSSDHLYAIVEQLANIAAEMQEQNEDQAAAILAKAQAIFDEANSIRESTHNVVKVVRAA